MAVVGAGRRTGVLALSVLALAAGAWLWLAPDPGPQAAGGDVMTTSAPEAERSLPPAAVPGAVERMPPEDVGGGALPPGAAEAGATAGGPAEADRSIVGRVVDHLGEPVPDTVVFLHPGRKRSQGWGWPEPWSLPRASWDQLAHTTTDPDGRFRLAPLKDAAPGETDEAAVEGPPWLVLLHPAHAVQAHRCVGWSADRSSSRGYDAGDALLSPGAILVGRCVDASGATVPDVRWFSPGGSGLESVPWDAWKLIHSLLEARSGPDGRFRLTSLWPGRQELRCTRPGFAGQSVNPTLVAGEVVDLGDVLMTRGGSLMGRVQGERGRPLPGVLVRARPAYFAALSQRLGRAGTAGGTALAELRTRMFSHGHHEAETHTGPDGRFELASLGRESYTLLFGKLGYEPLRRPDVQPDAPEMLVTLVPEASLLVSVLDSGTDEPVPGASGVARRRVGAQPDAQDPTLPVLAGAEAARAAGRAGDGQGLLLVRMAGPMATDLTITAPGYARTRFELPGVVAPARAEHQLRLRSAARITGRVLDAAGAPVAGATVELREANRPADAADAADERVTSNEAGRFVFEQLEARDWELRARHLKHVPSRPRVVALHGPERQEDIELVLGAAGRIVGVVVDRNSQPVPGTRVTATRTTPPPPGSSPTRTTWDTDGNRTIVYTYTSQGGAQQQVTSTDEQGRFAYAGLPPGDWEVLANPGARTIVGLNAGQVVDLVLTLRTPPLLRGHVREAGRAAPGVEVQVHPLVLPFLFEEETVITDYAGAWEQELRTAGVYWVVAQGAAGQRVGQRIEIDFDQERRVDLTFGDARLEGRLNASDGTPAARAAVRAFNETEGNLLEGQFNRYTHCSRRTRTDEEGRYVLEHLVPGPYAVFAFEQAPARSPDPARDEPLTRLTLVAGETRNLDLTLGP